MIQPKIKDETSMVLSNRSFQIDLGPSEPRAQESEVTAIVSGDRSFEVELDGTLPDISFSH